MNLDLNLLRGIYSYGFEKPTPIQMRGIVPVTTGRDVIAQAQSGTGKTGTFGIGSLQRLDRTCGDLQIIILSPTRELAQQTCAVVKCLSDFMKVNVCLCIGGTRIDPMELKTAQVIIGTPGRVYDMMQRGMLRAKSVHMFVLDEADEMLSHGFRDSIYDIFQMLPSSVQVCLFSATMPCECLEITEKFMRDPIKLLVKQELVTLEGIKQFYIATVEDKYKLETLVDIYDTISVCQTIIFCNSRRKVEWLADMLEQRDFTVSWVHGDAEYGERERVMQRFRTGASRILITTNLVARGINVQTVSLVINYDLPRDRESYIHRIGRGGRYGRKGVAISFVNDNQAGVLRDLERFYDTEIKEMPMNVAELF
jgi:translation initiation factor 4A